MPDIIISDTSCLILLSKMNMISFLTTVYGKVLVTEIVAQEFGEPLPSFIEIRKLTNTSNFTILEQEIDTGEASSIALALEVPNSTLLLDDKKARKMALKLNLPFTGLVGVFVQAKKRGKISNVKTYLESLKSAGMWISEKLFVQILKDVNES
jgi:predicted nucleic acid-binding protein